MSVRSLAPAVLGGVAVVVFSGLAAYFGAGLARPAPVVAPQTAAPLDSATRDSLVRQIDNLAHRIDLLELALGAARDAAPAPTTGPSTRNSVPAPAVHPPGEAPPQQQLVSTDPSAPPAAGLPRAREWALNKLQAFGDASPEAATNRAAQATGDAVSVVRDYGLRGDDMLENVRKIYVERWENGARDIGPLVRDGFGRADIATLRERLKSLDADTDSRLKPFFDEEKWGKYQADAAYARQVLDSALVDLEKARLGGK
jgi:hypothetical protein